MYTFWHYLRQRWKRDAGLRIDHLLLSRPAAERLISAGVDRDVRGAEGASDHARTWVELKARWAVAPRAAVTGMSSPCPPTRG